MDHSLYKDVTTSRGLKYHYYCSPSIDKKPTLCFIHGFPSTSYDWRYQIPFFQKEGCGLIVPDMLGYGGTDKPKDVALYKYSAISTDIIDILNAENIDKAIAIGHDWGSVLVSRLAVHYPDRILGFGLLATGYFPLNPDKDFKKLFAGAEEAVVSQMIGYWLFFAEDGADKIIESHYDSFFSMVYTNDPVLWRTDLAPMGRMKAWVLADKQCPLPPYLTEADAQKMKKTLLSGGLAGPLNYYRATVVSSIQAEDDEKNLPKENYPFNHPVFFGGAARDYLSISAVVKEVTANHCKNFTAKEFDTDHWVQLSAPDELNRELLAWIREIKV